MDNGSRSWPTNPWDALETKPAGYTTDAMMLMLMVSGHTIPLQRKSHISVMITLVLVGNMTKVHNQAIMLQLVHLVQELVYRS